MYNQRDLSDQRSPLDTSQQSRTQAAAHILLQRLQESQMGGNAANNALPAIIGEQYLIFALGDQELAVKAETVQGVERPVNITPVPNVVSWIKGVINLRGSIASVVDLRMFLSLEPSVYGPRTRLLSLQQNEMLICLVVDSVSEMVQIPDAVITRGNTNIPRWVAPYADGFALLTNRGNRRVVLLDVEHLLFSDKMQRY